MPLSGKSAATALTVTAFCLTTGKAVYARSLFLTPCFEMVSRRRSPIRQAAFCGALPERGQTALFRMRRRLCFHIKQCQILPRLQKVHYPQASRRAYEEKARPCYEVGAFRGFIFKGFQTRKSKGQGIYTFHPENAVLLRNKSIYRYP